jgi:hypothetical protein
MRSQTCIKLRSESGFHIYGLGCLNGAALGAHALGRVLGRVFRVERAAL